MRDNLSAAHMPCAPESTKTTVAEDLGDRWSRYCVLDRDGTIEEDRVQTARKDWNGDSGTRQPRGSSWSRNALAV
jgi:hypothetical protein